ncbi:hypothetical protein K458DRAFT_297004 [Lentithecium fluviatile CBS 122367]|uniref:Cytochrome P450 n=1 Tax=Lentithecium fluviatile CBS 122367 TaxID=1168545 RepID=A0A6G1J8A2_9PLEO|nr:hypothetical protein K458DRAFT_297004 [Lentithecium fluviatile CBS 122367]
MRRTRKEEWERGEGRQVLLAGLLRNAKASEKNIGEIVLWQIISGLASIHTMVVTVTWYLLELCRHPE